MNQSVPDPLFADCSDKVLYMRLCEMLIIVLNQLRVNSGYGHEDVNQGSLRAQQHLPHLEQVGRGREGERDKHKI